MNAESILFLLGGLTVGAMVAIFLRRGKSTDNALLHQRMDALNTGMLQQMQQFQLLLQTQLQEHRETLDKSGASVGQKLDQTTTLFNQVTERLAHLDEGSKQILAIGKDLTSLQDILKTPKLRGNLGELFLGDMLAQLLPKDQYKLQYNFKSGERVDAVVKLHDGLLVPIDAKFPMENFRRLVDSKNDLEKEQMSKAFKSDVKKHIDDIAKKYILPAEGTFDFALMYVPAENLYYETVLKDDKDDSVLSYAFAKKVIPVSPNTLYIYLQAILLGLKGLKIEEQAHHILTNLQTLAHDFEKFSKSYSGLGSHIQGAQTKYLETEKQINKIELRLSSVGEEAVVKLPDNPVIVDKDR
ncbi:MAG: DNA recombination protein RmuC [Patescibacteria group bacterium]|jgi:DNA recombination protein RmuC